MAIWADWALWVKLTLVLGLLIALVLIASTFVLIFQRWRIRRYAALEAGQKLVDFEQYPMLAQDDDVPFGARALERGIEVEGIWVSNSNTPVQTPCQPGTPRTIQSCSSIRSLSSNAALKQPPIQPEIPVTPPGLENIATSRASLPPFAPAPILSDAGVFKDIHYSYEPRRPGGVYSPLITTTSPSSPSRFNRRSNVVTSTDRRANSHTRAFRASQLSDTNSRASLNDLDELVLNSAGNDTSASAPVEQQPSRMTRLLQRRSSEEFRHRLSAIFNERIHMNMPHDQLQFDPTSRGKRHSLRNSLLGSWR